MIFPQSGLDLNPLFPPLISMIIATFTAPAGVSGAFLLLPIQVSVLGFNTPAVSATNHLYNIVAIPGGVFRYIKEKRMLWPLTWIVVAGTLPGVFGGIYIRWKWLSDPRAFKMFIGFVLLYISFRLIKDLFKRPAINPCKSKTSPQVSFLSFKCDVEKFTLSELVFEFNGEKFAIQTIGVFMLSLVVGIIGGIYGIGGGAIISPFLVSYWRLPIYAVAGAALMGTFVTSFAAVFGFAVFGSILPQSGVSPDWLLGILFGVGGLAGTYAGAAIQKFIPVRIIKVILILCTGIPGLRYIIQ